MSVKKKMGNIVLDDTGLTAEREFKAPDRAGTLADMQCVQDGQAGASYSFIAVSTNGVMVSDNDNLDFGTGDFSCGALFKCDFDTGANQFIFDKGSGSNTWGAQIVTSSGYLRINVGASTQNVSQNLIDGKWHHILLKRTSGAVELWLDGLKTSLSFSDSTSVSSAANLILGSWSSSGYKLAGQIARFFAANMALSDEKVRRYSAGAKLDYEDVGGSSVLHSSANAGSTTNEANATTGWVQGYATASFTSTSGNAHTGSYHLAFSGSGNGARMDYAFPVVQGKRYDVTIWSKDFSNAAIMYISTTNSGDNIYVYPTISSGTNPPGANQILNTTSTYTQQTFTFTADTTGTYYLSIRSSTSVTGKVDSVTISQLGAVLDLEPEGIGEATWADSSPNKLNGDVSGALAMFPSQEDPAQGTWTPACTNYGSTFGSVGTADTPKYRVANGICFFEFNVPCVTNASSDVYHSFSFTLPVPSRTNTSRVNGSCWMAHTTQTYHDYGTVTDWTAGNRTQAGITIFNRKTNTPGASQNVNVTVQGWYFI